jgi:predicted DNA-binding WGR domain protein
MPSLNMNAPSIPHYKCRKADQLLFPHSRHYPADTVNFSMRIYMQIPPEGDKAPRYYHLHLQEDLLEGWTLICEWGHQGMAGRVKREHFADHETAESALLKIRDEQIRRGFRIVFMQARPL